MDKKMIFAGVGGQGIVLATRIIGTALTLEGERVISTENHGMATRGGSVLSFLKVGNYHSPLLCYKEADIAVILHPDETEKVLPYITPSTMVIGYNLKIKGIELNQYHPKRLNIAASAIILKTLGIPMEKLLETLSLLGKNTPENIKTIQKVYTEN